MKKRVKTVELWSKILPMTPDNTVPSASTEKKVCSVCNEAKPYRDFGRDPYRCKACMAEKARRWNRKNRERFNANKRESHHRNKHSEHAQDIRLAYKTHRQKIRAEVLAAYGDGYCACCGESNQEFLTIDHIANDGAEHRRTIWGKSRNGSGSALYRWLKNQNFPAGYQVLCYNCNCGKAKSGGVCPHLSSEGVTTSPYGRTLKREEVRAIPMRDYEIVCSASRDAAVPRLIGVHRASLMGRW